MMKKSDFAFDLPQRLIANYPCAERSNSRLLFLGKGGLSDMRFCDLGCLLNSDDLLVFNDTAVIAARLRARKTSGARLEVLLHELADDDQAWVLLKPADAMHPGDELRCVDGSRLFVRRRHSSLFLLASPDRPWSELIAEHGSVPLPPYLRRPAEALDKERYQTVYARHPGSIAAPTAGLHFSQALIDSLRASGVRTATLTLHINYGTFQPIRSDAIEEHRMHKERFVINRPLCAAIARCRQAGARVVAVGTTVVRALESAAAASDGLRPGEQKTGLFIYPGHRFRVVDMLISNFHVSQSSLLILVCAFAGRESALRAYRHAVNREYRFLSYGDAMCMERHDLI